MKTKIILNEEEEINYPCLMINKGLNIVIYVVGLGVDHNYHAIALKHNNINFKLEVTGGWCVSDFEPLNGYLEMQNDYINDIND